MVQKNTNRRIQHQMDAVKDSEFLREIALLQDRRSFEGFFLRHKKAAYGLASNMLVLFGRFLTELATVQDDALRGEQYVIGALDLSHILEAIGTLFPT